MVQGNSLKSALTSHQNILSLKLVPQHQRHYQPSVEAVDRYSADVGYHLTKTAFQISL